MYRFLYPHQHTLTHPASTSRVNTPHVALSFIYSCLLPHVLLQVMRWPSQCR
jgi:hypothetical protein